MALSKFTGGMSNNARVIRVRASRWKRRCVRKIWDFFSAHMSKRMLPRERKRKDTHDKGQQQKRLSGKRFSNVEQNRRNTTTITVSRDEERGRGPFFSYGLLFRSACVLTSRQTPCPLYCRLQPRPTCFTRRSPMFYLVIAVGPFLSSSIPLLCVTSSRAHHHFRHSCRQYITVVGYAGYPIAAWVVTPFSRGIPFSIGWRVTWFFFTSLDKHRRYR